MQIILIFSSEISSNKQGSVTVWMLRQVINKETEIAHKKIVPYQLHKWNYQVFTNIEE